MPALNYGVFTLLSGSAAASVNSSPFFIGDSVGYAIQVVGTGVSGSITLQASCDYGYTSSVDDSVTVNNWTTLSGPLNISGSQVLFFNTGSAFYPWVRTSFTRVAPGAGTLEILGSKKKI